jgi:hypothetical protein
LAGGAAEFVLPGPLDRVVLDVDSVH